MRIDVYVSKRVSIFISNCIFACLVLCLSYLVHSFISTKDYQCTEGKILKVDKEIVYGAGEQDASSRYKVDISYEVDNKKYEASQYYNFKLGLKEDKSINVYYDTLNPEVIRGNNQTVIFVTIMFVVFFLYSLVLVKNANQ